jgi:hypothetical protein
VELLWKITATPVSELKLVRRHPTALVGPESLEFLYQLIVDSANSTVSSIALDRVPAISPEKTQAILGKRNFTNKVRPNSRIACQTMT